MIQVTSADLGTDSIGALELYSAWSLDGKKLRFTPASWALPYQADNFDTVTHQIPASGIWVDPEAVLYWDSGPGETAPARLNSLKRFSYMLGNRAVTNIVSVDEYVKSLIDATQSNEVTFPHGRSFEALCQLIGFYIQDTSGQNPERISRLYNTPARIIFRYSPPESEALKCLHEHLLTQQ
jgi:hypothetical protein